MEFGEEPLDFQIPDVAEPIVGYRSWLVEYQGPLGLVDSDRTYDIPTGPYRVVSRFGREAWEPGVPAIAICGNMDIFSRDRVTRGLSCEASPSRSKEGHHGFGCGIYSYKDPCRSASYHNPRTFTMSVWGEILMWGNVYEHEHGYRAQYAWPSGFACMRDLRSIRVAEGLAEAYGVGLIPDLREMPEAGHWNPLTRTLEATISEVDYLLDHSILPNNPYA